jgi:polysaccharide biosynthesis transport protein
MATEPGRDPRNLADHVGVLRRRVSVIAAVTAVAVLAALGWSLRQPERYRATTQVLVSQEVPTAADPLPDQQIETRRTDPLRVMQNEVRLASSDLVKERTARAVGDPVTGSVTNPRDTDVVSIAATASSAERAAELAGAWATAYLEVRDDDLSDRLVRSSEQIERNVADIDERLAAIDTELAGSTGERRAALEAERATLADQRAVWDQQRRVIEANAEVARASSARVIDIASAPGGPFQPTTTRNLVLALLVGLSLGLVAAYALDALDDRIRSPADLRRLIGLPVLGRIAPATTGLTAVTTDDPSAVRLDAVELADLALDPAILDAPAPGDAHVLLVAAGTRASDARQKLEALDRLGIRLAGTALIARRATRGADTRGDVSRTTAGGGDQRTTRAGERLPS